MNRSENNQNDGEAMETDQQQCTERSASSRNRKRGRMSLSPVGQGESRADQLSMSLANIAREEQRARKVAARAPDGMKRTSEESSLYFSSSDLADRAGRLESRVPLVTASTSTSSGEDRCSSGENAKHRTTAGASLEVAEERQTFLGYGYNRHSMTRHPGSDTLGLPVPRDDGAERIISHASVVAKLPPPRHQPLVKAIPRQSNKSPCSEGSSGGGSWSGSGSDGGYAASASDQHASCSSPSASSEDGSDAPGRRVGFTVPYNYTNTGASRRNFKRGGAEGSSSSILADFSSSTGFDVNGESSYEDGPQMHPTKRHLEGTSAPGGRKRRTPNALVQLSSLSSLFGSKVTKATQRRYQTSHHALAGRNHVSKIPMMTHSSGPYSTGKLLNGQSPIFSLNSDTMAHMVTFLEPPQVHSFLTMPLSKQWASLFTCQQELWRTLCVMEPFKAKFDSDETDSDAEKSAALPLPVGADMKALFGKHRLLYTSYVRCMRYLARIKDDAVHGRAPSVVDYGSVDMSSLNVSNNSSLKKFFSKANGFSGRKKAPPVVGDQPLPAHSADSSRASSQGLGNRPVGVTDDAISIESLQERPVRQKPKVRLGHSTLTQRLLGPSQTGQAGNVNLPWSCAIYSIVNWMVAFSDVEGIQTMCLSVFPHILEDESQRMTAQRAGLTDIVLRGMVLYPDSASLHTAAFHTIVLLARPLGGKEGMLFHSSMVNSSGIFGSRTRSGRNGIAVMLDSMHRFGQEASLQAMSCWSMVNIALAPSQKTVLVKLGGIGAIADAMLRHPRDAEVQFRALFALINLVIPSVKLRPNSSEDASLDAQLGDVNETTEKEMLDEQVGQITNLVVLAMKNFCSSESILNRACLVLHNLSLTSEYHESLLLTPNFYQMLEWCLANYRTDQVLQQSAAGTLHRLQTTLAMNDQLRERFTSSIRSQQQTSLLQAQQEAIVLREQQTEEQTGEL